MGLLCEAVLFAGVMVFVGVGLLCEAEEDCVLFAVVAVFVFPHAVKHKTIKRAKTNVMTFFIIVAPPPNLITVINFAKFITVL